PATLAGVGHADPRVHQHHSENTERPERHDHRRAGVLPRLSEHRHEEGEEPHRHQHREEERRRLPQDSDQLVPDLQPHGSHATISFVSFVRAINTSSSGAVATTRSLVVGSSSSIVRTTGSAIVAAMSTSPSLAVTLTTPSTARSTSAGTEVRAVTRRPGRVRCNSEGVPSATTRPLCSTT